MEVKNSDISILDILTSVAESPGDENMKQIEVLLKTLPIVKTEQYMAQRDMCGAHVQIN